MNFERIIKQIDNIAPLSDAIVKIQDMYTNNIESLDIAQLVKLIESDSTLSANILKMANSPMYGFSSRVASISQAVTLFGIMQVYGFIISYASTKHIKASTEIFGTTNQEFNDICNIQSALLLEWYSKINEDDARFLAPLALIMEIGKLVMANEVLISEYTEEFKIAYEESIDVELYEKEFFGATSYDISALVFKHWHLEPMYVHVLQNLSNSSTKSPGIELYSNILKVIVTSVNLKSVLSKESVSNAYKEVKKMGLNPDEFVQAALKIKKLYKEELHRRENNLSE